MKENLFGKTITELKVITDNLSLPAFTAQQLTDWLYKKNSQSIDEMTNLSKAAREKLADNYVIRHNSPQNVQESKDGTKKYLFGTENGKFIEAAYIPEKERYTLCVSSQIGCKMGCLFCMTGKQGYQGNLSVEEILNQIVSIPEKEKITNIVYMGMGEPLDNLEQVMKSLEILTASYGFGMSPSRITVSSIGLIPTLRTFIENSKCHLAISLHTPFSEERKRLMPIESVYPIREIIETLKAANFGKQRRISFEYIMFKDLNDTPRHVKELARLLDGLRCRINLIRFHPIPDTPLQSSDEDTIHKFSQELNKKGILTTVRASRGLDILAACGLLSTKQLIKTSNKDYEMI